VLEIRKYAQAFAMSTVCNHPSFCVLQDSEFQERKEKAIGSLEAVKVKHMVAVCNKEERL
jgi:uncharacterized Fe-S cluster protein YjdI